MHTHAPAGHPNQPLFAIATNTTHKNTYGLLAVALAERALVVGDRSPMGIGIKQGLVISPTFIFKTPPHVTQQNPVTLQMVIMPVLTMAQSPQPTSPPGGEIWYTEPPNTLSRHDGTYH